MPVRGPLVVRGDSSDEISTANAGALNIWASSDKRGRALIIITMLERLQRCGLRSLVGLLKPFYSAFVPASLSYFNLLID